MNHIILTPQTAKLVKEVVVKEVSLVDFLNSINNNEIGRASCRERV